MRAAAALSILLLAAASRAQTETLRAPAFADQRQDERVAVDITPVLAAQQRRGHAGFVTCSFENPDAQAHDVTVAIGSWSERVLVRDTLRLEPRQRVTRHYAVQRYGRPPYVEVTCDDGPEQRTNQLGTSTSAIGVLLVTPRADAVGELQIALSAVVKSDPPEPAPRGRRVSPGAAASAPSPIGVTEVRPAALPETWQCYAGFDLLVVDGRGTLGAAAEQAIVQAVAAGGSLLVVWAESLGDGPLKLAMGGRTSGALALGRFLACSAAPRTAGALAAWLDDGGRGVTTAVKTRVASGPASDGLYAPLQIPGLGAVPVGAFFVLLTLFVVLAGPVNLFLCRRAGRPLLVALTLPVLGFGFAAAILLWGVLVEGLGVRGSVRSFTWLDQRTHVSVNHAGATLFAGLTPSALTPDAGTAVSTMAIAEDWRAETSHRLVIDHGAGGRMSGSLVPARVQTNVVTVTHRRTRERVRFRRLQDGNLEALFGPGLVPAAPGLIVRDHAGQHFAGTPDGGRAVLLRVDASAARSFLGEARQAFINVPAQDGEQDVRHYSRVMPHVVGGSASPGDALTSSMLEMLVDLQPGTYAGWFADNAAFDALGLEVAWEVQRHLVFGLLAEEDFVD